MFCSFNQNQTKPILFKTPNSPPPKLIPSNITLALIQINYRRNNGVDQVQG